MNHYPDPQPPRDGILYQEPFVGGRSVFRRRPPVKTGVSGAAEEAEEIQQCTAVVVLSMRKCGQIVPPYVVEKMREYYV